MDTTLVTDSQGAGLPWLIDKLPYIFFATVGAIFGWLAFRRQKRQEKRELAKEAEEKATKAEEEKKPLTAEEQYKAYLLSQYRYINFRGLGVGGVKLELQHAYIHLRAKPHYQAEDYHSLEEFKLLNEERSKWDKKELVNLEKAKFLNWFLPGVFNKESEEVEFDLAFQKLHKYKTKHKEALKLLIVGQPGSGKTTLMKWIALQCAMGLEGYNQFVPLLFRLKAISDDKKLLEQSILELIKEDLRKNNLNSEFVDKAFVENRLLILLDGLDEIAEDSIRRKTIEKIEDTHLQQNSLIITSRFSGLNKKGLQFSDNFTAFAVTDFTIEEVAQFLYNWYRQVEQADSNSYAEKQRAEAESNRQAEELIDTLRSDQYESLRSLAVNPLLLTLTAIIHYRRGKLPKYRYKLYESCIEILADTWLEVNRGKGMSTNYDECLHLLGLVASQMMRQGTRRIKAADIKHKLEQAGIDKDKQSIFFKDVVQRAGILVESEGTYEFLHLTFQEYLTAYYYSQLKKPELIFEQLESEHSAFWTEPIKLLINLGNAQQLFGHIINQLDQEVYWKQMNLWEDCLSKELTIKTQQEKIEKQFASKILEIFTQLPFDESKEKILHQFLPSYVLYIHSNFFHSQANKLLQEAPHPFVRSIGASILNKIDSKNNDLFEQLSSSFKSIKKDALTFFMQHDNTITIQYIHPKTISCFVELLQALKTSAPMQQLKIMIDLEDLRYFGSLGEVEEYEYLQGLFHFHLCGPPDLVNLEYLGSLRVFRYLRDLVEPRKLRELQDPRYFRYLRSITNQYYQYFIVNYKQFRPKIEDWATIALQNLQRLPDKKIIKFFPNTKPEEIEALRELKINK